MRKTFTLRLHKDTLEKLHQIASTDKRSVNSLLELLAEKCIKDFERENGEIQVPREA